MNKYKHIRAKLKKDRSLLFFDIETSPNLLWSYPVGYNINVPVDQIELEGKITSIAYHFEGYPTKYLEWKWQPLIFKNGKLEGGGNDSEMVEEFVNILNTAKVAIGQNSDSFDIGWLRWRLNCMNLTPMAELTTLDTFKLAKNSFYAPSLKLDYRSQKYGFGGKIKQDMQDCIAVAKGDKKKQKQRIKYNIKDDQDTAKIFWKELPYYKSLPVSLAQLIGNTREFCPRCAAAHQRKFDVYPTKINNKSRWKCNNCGHIWKDTRKIK